MWFRIHHYLSCGSDSPFFLVCEKHRPCTVNIKSGNKFFSVIFQEQDCAPALGGVNTKPAGTTNVQTMSRWVPATQTRASDPFHLCQTSVGKRGPSTSDTDANARLVAATTVRTSNTFLPGGAQAGPAKLFRVRETPRKGAPITCSASLDAAKRYPPRFPYASTAPLRLRKNPIDSCPAAYRVRGGNG